MVLFSELFGERRMCIIIRNILKDSICSRSVYKDGSDQGDFYSDGLASSLGISHPEFSSFTSFSFFM